MSWFVDKLGPIPGAAQPAKMSSGKAAPAPSRQAPQQRAAPPAPEKPKKKGWF